MTPLRLSHVWHRRLYMTIFLLSFLIIALYGLRFYSGFAMPVVFTVSLVSGVSAGIAAITSLGLFLYEKKLSNTFLPFVPFAFFTLAIAMEVVRTGGIDSPYLILWTLIAFFAALFGLYGWVSVAVLVGIFTTVTYLDTNLNFETIVTVVLGSIAPLLAGIIVWRDQGEIDDSTKNVKNLANQLSEVASTSEIVINAIGDGVMAIDSKGTIQLINPAAQEILGWGKQDALMLSYKSILKLEDENGKDLTLSAEPIESVLNTNQQARANDLIAVTKSGKKISVDLVITPIGDTGSGAIVVFRDITKERSEEREQAEFISTASHEMRTPVASIEGYLGLAINPATATIDERAKDFIQKAQEAAKHLGRLFQDLLDVSKADDGRMTNVPKVANIVTLTETIVQGLTQKAADKNLRLVFSPTNSNDRKIMPVYYVNQDNDHIREILDNLIENAIKYTPAGQVIIDINGEEDRVIISIKDSGLGIPAEDIPHLFQKFYRVSNMDRQEIGGTGLGLYLVRRLTESIQGRVWVESVLGKGSTFFLELPRVETQEAERLQKEQQNAARPVTPAAQPAPLDTQEAPVAPPVQPIPQPVPQIPPQMAPQSAAPQPVPQSAPQPAPTTVSAPPAPSVRPATSVPRGQTLTREQINERVKQLEALSRQQRGSTGR